MTLLLVLVLDFFANFSDLVVSKLNIKKTIQVKRSRQKTGRRDGSPNNEGKMSPHLIYVSTPTDGYKKKSFFFFCWFFIIKNRQHTTEDSNVYWLTVIFEGLVPVRGT